MPAFSTIVDDFSTSTIRTDIWINYGPTTVVNGRARIPSNDTWPTLNTDRTYDLTGSSVFVQFFPAAKGDTTATNAYSKFLVESNTAGTELACEHDTDTGDIVFSSNTGWWDDFRVVIPYDAATMRWLRIREAAGTAYWDTSPDGITWTNRKSVATPDWVALGNSRLMFQTYRVGGTMDVEYMEVDNVNVAPVVEATPPATPTGLTATAAGTDATLAWTPSAGATSYDVEYELVSNPPVTQAAEPWSTVTLPAGTWTQTAGQTVTLTVSGTTTTFTAPPSMSARSLSFTNGTDQVNVNVSRARNGIVQADGTVKPVRLRRVPIPSPGPNAVTEQNPVDASVRSYASVSHDSGVATRTVPRPPHVVAGDLLVNFAVSDTGGLETYTPPAGWTQLVEQNAGTGGTARIFIHYKVATAADTTTAGWDWVEFNANADGASVCVAVKDWDGNTANLVSANTPLGNTTFTAPALTPKTGRGLLLTSVAHTDGNGTTWGWIPPAGAGAVGYGHNTVGFSSTAVSQETWNDTTPTGTRTWTANTPSTVATKMAASLLIGSGIGTKTVTRFTADTTGGAGGALTDTTGIAFEDSTGLSSTYHLYADGLDWTKKVGLLVYTDGSGEWGLDAARLNDPYLLGGANGMIAVAKRQNMILLTPRAPGTGCSDGDGVCWYDHSPDSNTTPQQKLDWSHELIEKVLLDYDIDRTRIVLGGYSSGAQWTTGWYGPRYAADIMIDGAAVAISYGGQPRVDPTYTDMFKTAVPFVWDVGDADTAYTQPTWDDGVQTGRAWYQAAGFATTHLELRAGVGHARDGAFGQIIENAITTRVPLP